jgi:hypothetical protein
VRTTWDRVLAWRTARHHLARPSDAGPVEVARRLGGVQAQVLSSAQLAIALRSTAVAPDDVARAVWDERTLVKTWTARGTLHLVPADELPLWVAVLRREQRFQRGAWLRANGITLDDLDTVLAAMPEALDGKALTRAELASEVARVSGRPHLAEAMDGSWGSMLKPAAFRGLVCFGPNRGRNVTFVSPPDWIGAWREVDADEAAATVVRRYLDAYGPATLADVARWFGLELAPAKKLFAGAFEGLVPVNVDGEAAWATPEGAESLGSARATKVVRLLAGFDPYVVGSLGRLDQLAPAVDRALVSRPSGWISAVLLVGGRVAGTWTSTAAKGRTTLAITPFAALEPKVTAAAEADAARLGRQLGTDVEVVWTSAP